jgi:N-acyl-D-amino-acid deacylase
MQAWDAAAEHLMSRYGLPSASLAVAYEGRVVLEHGYGYADTSTHALVQPDSAFRLASVTKSLTAAAIDVLIEHHQLSLGTRPFVTILGKLRAPHNKKPVDSRIRQITISDLLNMKGGWDINKLGYDPVFNPGPEQQALALHSPPTCEQAIEYMLGKRLNYNPGTHYSYSNLGYCVLGDTVAHVMHTSYAQALKKLLLDPIGMRSTAPSAGKLTTRLPNEVHYYGQGSEASGSQSPYHLPLTASLGAAGMVSTALDLERYLIVTGGAVPGSSPYPTFGGSNFVGVLAPTPATGGYQWEWDGSLPGTSASMIVSGKVTAVFLSNSRPGSGPDFSIFRTLATQQTSWPSGNLLSPPAP